MCSKPNYLSFFIIIVVASFNIIAQKVHRLVHLSAKHVKKKQIFFVSSIVSNQFGEKCHPTKNFLVFFFFGKFV